MSKPVIQCYTGDMAKQQRDVLVVDLSTHPGLKEKLEKEAALDNRSLSNYVKVLLTTHPKRLEKKSTKA